MPAMLAFENLEVVLDHHIGGVRRQGGLPGLQGLVAPPGFEVDAAHAAERLDMPGNRSAEALEKAQRIGEVPALVAEHARALEQLGAARVQGKALDIFFQSLLSLALLLV